MIKNKYLTQIEATLDLYFGKKAPPMPENIKELIVKFSPHLIILAIALSFIDYLGIAGISGVSGLGAVSNFSLWGLLALAALVIEAIAIPGLLKRTKQSWELMFYAALITLVSNLLSLNLDSLLISGIISFYILFQIKSYYKN